jgi:hypothetical protein
MESTVVQLPQEAQTTNLHSKQEVGNQQPKQPLFPCQQLIFVLFWIDILNFVSNLNI